MSECQTKAGNLECMNVSMFWTTFVLCLCSKLSFTLSHSHTLLISHSITLDMLNKFCLYVYVQKSLLQPKIAMVFFYLSSITLPCYFRCHRAGSQQKMSERQTKAGNQITLSLSLTISLSLSHSFNLSFNHSWHAKQLLFWSLCSKLTLTLSHSHSLSLSHSFSLSHSLIQSLSTCWTSFVFMSRLKSHCLLTKIAMVFFWPHHPHPVSLEFLELVPS